MSTRYIYGIFQYEEEYVFTHVDKKKLSRCPARLRWAGTDSY